MDEFGILLPDPFYHGTRYVPWNTVTELIERAATHEFYYFQDRPVGPRHPLDAEILSLLESAGAIEPEVSGTYTYFRPRPDLRPDR